MNSNNINIALITDKNYFVPAMVTMKSMMNKTKRNLDVKCILTEEVGLNTDELAQELQNEFPHVKMEFVFFDDSLLKNVKTKFHVSRAAYVKIYLPEILSDWNKCIFLDSDLLIRKDIGQLWDIEMDKELGAVWNPGYNKDNEVMGLGMEEETFNSGVLVMNLESMRMNNSSKALEIFIRDYNHLTHLNDQAAFNAIYKREWFHLPVEWNGQFLFYLRTSSKIGISKAEQKEMKKNPAIVHFTTSSKPWKYRSSHPFKKEFLSYFNTIPTAKYQGKVTIVDTLKRCREIFLLIKSNF